MDNQGEGMNATAVAVTNKAIQQVGDNADELFKQTLRASLARVAGRLNEFTTDDIWTDYEFFGGKKDLSSRERSTVGAIVREAAQKGFIKAVATPDGNPKAKRSDRPSAHGRLITVFSRVGQ
jgi:hypothetical protein